MRRAAFRCTSRIDENIFRSHHPISPGSEPETSTGCHGPSASQRSGCKGWAILELDAAADPPAQIAAAKQFVDANLVPILT